MTTQKTRARPDASAPEPAPDRDDGITHIQEPCRLDEMKDLSRGLERIDRYTEADLERHAARIDAAIRQLLAMRDELPRSLTAARGIAVKIANELRVRREAAAAEREARSRAAVEGPRGVVTPAMKAALNTIRASAMGGAPPPQA